MLSFLDEMRIGRRIALAFMLPVVGLIAFSGFVIIERWLVVEDTRSLIGVAELASDVGAVVHELQKERGSSSLFLASQGSQFGDRLAQQRTLTDKAALRVVEGMTAGAFSKLGSSFAQALDKGRLAIEARTDIRGRVDTQLINSRVAMAEYSSVIKMLLDLVAEIAVATPDKRTSGLATAYLSFIEAKEHAGQERAVGSAGFAGGFDLALERRYLALQAQQETLLSMFERQAPSRLADMLREQAKSPTFTLVAKMREQQAVGIGQAPVSASAWFDAATKRIDGLKEIEDSITSQLLATASTVYGDARTFLIVQVAAVVFGLSITFLVALVVARGLTKPLVRLTDTMTRLAHGDITVEVDNTKRQNEIGDMARAVAVFRSDRIAAQRLEAAQQAEQADKERRRLAVEALTRTFEQEASAALTAVRGASGELRNTATALDKSAGRMAEHTTAVAQAANETSDNVQSVAAAAEELSASIAEIGRRAAESASVSADAVNEAERTNSLVSGLASAVNSIGEVVGLINDIASQTNLLALNATIEAARAGEAGKGFAVVANEVKGLANQTAKATDQISAQVHTVQQATRDAVTAIGAIGNTIARISEIASAIAAAVDQQDATTRAIARNAQDAAGGTLEVSNHVADVTGEAADTGTNADRVLEAADALTTQSSSLQTSVESYLAGVAAA